MNNNKELEISKKRIEKLEAELASYLEKFDSIVEAKTSELKLSEEKFRLLFEKSHDPILIIDNYEFVECNEAAAKLLGLKSTKDIYKIHPSKISPKYQPDGRLSSEKANELMDLAYKNGYQRFEWMHVNMQKNKEICIDVALTKIPYKGKNMIFTIWRDISRQKEYERNKDLKKEGKSEREREGHAR